MHAPETLAALHDRLEDNRKLLGTTETQSGQPAPTPGVALQPSAGIPQPEEENKDVA